MHVCMHTCVQAQPHYRIPAVVIDGTFHSLFVFTRAYMRSHTTAYQFTLNQLTKKYSIPAVVIDGTLQPGIANVDIKGEVL